MKLLEASRKIVEIQPKVANPISYGPAGGVKSQNRIFSAFNRLPVLTFGFRLLAVFRLLTDYQLARDRGGASEL